MAEHTARAVPIGRYSLVQRHESSATTSGHPPLRADGTLVAGRLGHDLDVSSGVDAARLAAEAALHSLDQELTPHHALDRILDLTVYVNAHPSFTDHATVADGASSAIATRFPGEPPPTRSAVGVSSLPLGICVEVALTAAIHPLPTR